MSGHNFAYSKTREQDLALMLTADVSTNIWFYQNFRFTSVLKTAPA